MPISNRRSTLVVLVWVSLACPGYAGLVTLGDPNFNAGNSIDSWDSNMVIQESYSYINNTGAAETISVQDWSFDAGADRGRVTPFLVVLNDTNSNGNLFDDNNFSVKWVGTTAISDTSAGGAGLGDWGAGDVGTTISFAQSGSFTLADGETLAIGYLNSDAAGTNTGDPGSVITWDSSLTSGHMWYNGNPSPNVYPNGVPVVGGTLSGAPIANVQNRSYNFSVTFSNSPEPSALVLLLAAMLPTTVLRRRTRTSVPRK